MNILKYIVEPEKLLLTWLPPDDSGQPRTRRVVGEIAKDPQGNAVFRYLKDTPDFVAARGAGFKQFPPFSIKDSETTGNVIDALMRRLPPRNREDFNDYLASHLLPIPFNYSDFALLGYTGAKLPSDGFSLVPIFPEGAVPCDYLAEVAGLRHELRDKLETIQAGDPISLEVDRDNPVDRDAMAVIHNSRRIGYINRAFKGTVIQWLSANKVTAFVERITRKPERPLVYIKISVT